MQSFLQYRRFRATVEAQLERDQAKADAFRTQGRHRQTEQPSQNSVSSDDSKHDLEKGIERDDFAPREPHPPHPEATDLEASTTKEQEEEMVAEQRRFEEAEEPSKKDDEDDEDDDFDLQVHRTISRATTMSAGNALGTILTGVDVRRRTTKECGEGNVFVVGYEGPDDPNDPQWVFRSMSSSISTDLLTLIS